MYKGKHAKSMLKQNLKELFIMVSVIIVLMLATIYVLKNAQNEATDCDLKAGHVCSIYEIGQNK